MVDVADPPAAPPAPAAARGAGPSWRRAALRGALALSGGVALYAAHPPLGWRWAAPLGLWALIALARSCAEARRPGWTGFAWGSASGLVTFAPLVWWMLNVELLAWLLLAPSQALFTGFATALLACWGHRAWRAPIAVAVWVAFEQLRSEAPFGGFPWGLVGYSQADGGSLLGVARLGGVLAISALLVGLAAAADSVWVRLRAGTTDGLGRTVAPALGGIGVIAVVATAGAVSAPPPTTGSIDVMAIQGYATEGSVGRGVTRAEAIASDHVELTARALADGADPDIVIWGENAVDADITDGRNPAIAAHVAEALEVVGDRPLLSGLITEGPRERTSYNEAALFTDSVEPDQRYVKRQLVPFGEYIPFRSLFEWIPQLDRVPYDGLPGEAPTVIDAAGHGIGAVICFEIIFPNLVRDQVDAGADVLAVLTNNSSFGRGAASEQHQAFSSLRAVETGRSLVHAALTGSSAVVDAEGRVTEVTDLYSQAVIETTLETSDGRTLAMVLGDAVGRLAQLVALAALIGMAIARRRATVELAP